MKFTKMSGRNVGGLMALAQGQHRTVEVPLPEYYDEDMSEVDVHYRDYVGSGTPDDPSEIEVEDVVRGGVSIMSRLPTDVMEDIREMAEHAAHYASEEDRARSMSLWNRKDHDVL